MANPYNPFCYGPFNKELPPSHNPGPSEPSGSFYRDHNRPSDCFLFQNPAPTGLHFSQNPAGNGISSQNEFATLLASGEDDIAGAPGSEFPIVFDNHMFLEPGLQPEFPCQDLTEFDLDSRSTAGYSSVCSQNPGSNGCLSPQDLAFNGLSPCLESVVQPPRGQDRGTSPFGIDQSAVSGGLMSLEPEQPRDVVGSGSEWHEMFKLGWTLNNIAEFLENLRGLLRTSCSCIEKYPDGAWKGDRQTLESLAALLLSQAVMVDEKIQSLKGGQFNVGANVKSDAFMTAKKTINDIAIFLEDLRGVLRACHSLIQRDFNGFLTNSEDATFKSRLMYALMSTQSEEVDGQVNALKYRLHDLERASLDCGRI